jgi:AAHS family 4-hydroxybenzoate transporter-like MFS transporter
MIAPVDGVNATPLQSLIDRGQITALQIRVVVLCALAFVTEGIDLNLIPLLAPTIERTWALPASAFGAIFAAGPVGLVIGGFVAGYVADLVGRRWSLIIAMTVMSLSTLATAFVHNVPELLVCRILTGIGFGGVIPAASTLVSEFMPARLRTSMVAFVILATALGTFLAAVFMKIPAVASNEWHTIVLYVAALCVVTTLLLLAFLPESPRYLLLKRPASAQLKNILQRLRITEQPAAHSATDGTRLGGNQVVELFKDGKAMGTCLLWITFLGVCWTVSFFSTWLTLIFTRAGMTDADGVSASAAYSLGAMVGGLVLPLFCVRWNVNRVLMLAILAGALSSGALGSVLVLGSSASLALTFVCGVFISGAFFMLYPPAVRFYPTVMRSTGIGSAVAFGRIGNILSPKSAGWMLGAGYSPNMVFWAMGAPMVASFVALLLFHRLTARRGADADVPMNTVPAGSAPGSAPA